MDAVEFCGVVFRSKDHLAWFKGSMFYFLALGGTYALCYFYRTKEISRCVLRKIWPVWCGFCIFRHVAVSIGAVVITDWGKVNGALFSVDCIWFNALLGAVYMGAFFLNTRVVVGKKSEGGVERCHS